MPVVAPPALTAPPTSPDRNDAATFVARAFALDDFRRVTEKPEYTALALNVAANATDAATTATAAAAAAVAALASQNTAALSAAAAASSAGAPLWTSGATYALFAKATSTLNGLPFNRIIAGAGTTDPSLDAVNWSPLVLFVPPQVLFPLGVI